MTVTKQKILQNICYTELVYQRINKKLNADYSKQQIELFIHQILKDTDEAFYCRTGKNFYVTNSNNNIRITINAMTFRIITVDRLKKLIRISETMSPPHPLNTQ
ncbi:MAG: DUF3781 domain-containing protein [Bacteroidales bacterium]|nr:DUF3781 domain-containing protein [Bacteroidales bacterium]